MAREGIHDVIQIPKRSGGYRTIYIPTLRLKSELRPLLPIMFRYIRENDTIGAVHGFQPGCSPLTNAARHISFAYTVSWDLADFFDHVVPSMLDRFFDSPRSAEISTELQEKMFPDGAARQGLPTSPALANIAALPMDRALFSYLCEVCSSASCGVYTRYADDLTFSVLRREEMLALRETVPRIVRSFGFELAPRKHRVQWYRHGRRIITGVSVGNTLEDGLAIPRRFRRRLRAAEHYFSTHDICGAHYEGLDSWRSAVQRFNRSADLRHLAITLPVAAAEWPLHPVPYARRIAALRIE